MGKTLCFGLVFTIALVYIIFFNLLSHFSINAPGIYNSVMSKEVGGGEEVGFGDHVDVRVTGKRLFGTIERKGNAEINSTFFIFGLVPLPLEFSGSNFKYLHIVIFSILLVSALFFLLRSERRYTNDEISF